MALSVASGRFAHDFFKCAAHSITVGETAFVSNLSNREAGVDKKVCCCVRSYINKILSESEACKSLKFLGKARFTHIKKFGSSSHSYVIVIILDNIFNNLLDKFITCIHFRNNIIFVHLTAQNKKYKFMKIRMYER